jgi:acetylornithine/LysW-gamma-L-lysine aminotransferase
VPGIRHVPYNKLDRLEAAVSDRTAAVILEVVQGEGGVNPGTAEFLLGAQEICRQRGALLILDEVQTGFGRTGRMFALEHHGLEPDLLCVAKSLGGGVPIGATLLGKRVAELHPGLHGSTFGGNPLSAAAAAAALDVLVEEALPARAAEMGAHLMDGLRAIESPLVREVRGLGLMVGIELKRKAAPYLLALQARGVLALNAGMNVIRLLPPLVITREQVERVIAALGEVLENEG